MIPASMPQTACVGRRLALAAGLGGMLAAAGWPRSGPAFASTIPTGAGTGDGWRLHVALGRPMAGGEAIAFAPNGRWVAVASRSHIHLHDLRTLREIRRLAGTGNWIRGLAIAAEGSRLVAATLYDGFDVFQLPDGEIRTSAVAEAPIRIVSTTGGALLAAILERLDSGTRFRRDVALFAPGERPREIARLGERANEAADLALDNEGSRLAVVREDGRVLIAELRSFGRLREIGAPGPFAGRRPLATALAFAPSGLSVAVGDAEGGIRLLDVSRGTDTEMGRHGAAIYRMAFAPDGRLFTASQDGRITVHDPDAPGRRPSRMELPAGLVDLQVSPDGRHVAALLARGDVHIHDAVTLRERKVLRDTSTFATWVALSGDAGRLAVICSDAGGADTLWLWDLGVARDPIAVVRRRADGRAASLGVAAFSSDGRSLAVASGLRCIHLIDFESGRDLRRLVRTTADGDAPVEPWDVVFTPDGNILVGYRDGLAVLWSTGTGQELARFGSAAGPEAPAVVAVTPDGGRLAVVAGQEGARSGTVYATTSGAVLGRFPANNRQPGSCAFVQGDATIAIGSPDDGRSIALWNVQEGSGAALSDVASWITSLAAAEACVLAGTADGALWFADGRPVPRMLRGHADAVHSVALAQDARTAASASADGTCRVWCTASGRELLRLVHSSTGQWIGVAADGYAWWSEEAEPLLSLVHGLEARATGRDFRAAAFRHRSLDQLRGALGLALND